MKFTIRDLILVTVIVAIGLGWWVDRSRIKEELEILKYHAQGEGQISTRYDAVFEISGKKMIAKIPNGVTYSRTWPNEDWTSNRVLPNSSAPAPNPPKK
jgi:hypothetical protein